MVQMGSEVLILLGTITLLFFIITLAVFVAFHQKRVLRKDIEQKEIEHQYQISLIETKIETQENERKQIAEDLHDEIAPMLATANLYVKVGLQSSVSEEQIQNQEAVREMIENAILRIRQVSHLLHPVVVDTLGLKVALEDIASKLNKTENVEMELVWEDTDFSLDKVNELALYRLLQELIMNALKHGQANKYKISFSRIDLTLFIKLEHNGSKFGNKEYEELINSGQGMGLKNIQNRLKMLGGDISYSYNESSNLSEIALNIPVEVQVPA